jgi:parallel beta-helix repeat protein
MLRIIVICLVALTSVANAEIRYYVAPNGSDGAQGTIDAPFQSLEKARDEIRGLSTEQRRENIRVILRSGTYKLIRTFVLEVEDGASLGLTVSYEAYPGETPVLDSGVEITGWQLATVYPEGTPEAAKGNLYVADMPQGLERFYALFDETGFIDRARAPFVTDPKLPMTDENGIRTRWLERDVLHYASGPFRQWHNIGDIEIYKKPTRNWVANFLQLKSVNLATKTAITSVKGTYKLSDNPAKKQNRVEDIEEQGVDQDGELCNVPEGLTRPGTWIVDTVQRKVYLWPRNVAQLRQRIVAPTLTEYIRVDGRNDEWGDKDVPVRGISIKGLTFIHGKRLVLRKDSRGIQHDWEMFDENNAYIRLRGAENCTVSECSFLNGANSGIRLDLYCQNNRVENNRLDNLGYTGVLLCGYGPGTKDVNKGNIITNNEISRVGRLWFHGLAIFVFQSGHNTISHNYIHDIFYDAIVVSGVRPRFFGWEFKDFPDFPNAFPDIREIMRIMRWKEIGGKPATFKDCLDYAHSRGNIIEYNEINAAMAAGGDGNALYLSGTIGNVFRYNMVYSSPTPPGMFRNDDEQYESQTYGNILIGMNGPYGGVILKHENTFENNMVFNWGTWAVGMSHETIVNRNIFWHPGDQAEFYRFIDVLKGDNNIFHAATNEAGAGAWLKKRQATGWDGNSTTAAPMFQDLEHYNFTLRPGSPALERGFEQVPFERIGLLSKPTVMRLRESGLNISQLMAGERVRD